MRIGPPTSHRNLDEASQTNLIEEIPQLRLPSSQETLGGVKLTAYTNCDIIFSQDLI